MQLLSFWGSKESVELRPKISTPFLKRWYPIVRIYSRKGGEAVEEQWIREIQRKGFRTAADHLIRAHYDEIYRFIYRQTGYKEDAMDLTQSISLAMLRALPPTGRSGGRSAPGFTASPPTKSSIPTGDHI